ncbi:flagellar hook-length control protein FliK [Maritimibacter sp. 55A14]|uniref:flagellar hook-length control protein FliK n=1 Tax=Maritimibacter sp. 55A14 TaxID=2174844 RepID=UPI001304C749|nr:flagellar hook-length control protein FliK [Maritimibacter sp. 55A14]
MADIALADTGVTGRGGEMRAPPAGAERAEQPTTAQLVRAVAAQLVDGFRGSSARHVEILLEPRELGHVRMTLSLSDQGGNVTLTADRPETLDLMRRHIGILSQEFADLGYRGVEFSFAGGGGQDAGDGRHAAGGGVGAAPAGAPAAEPQAVAAAGMQMALPLSDGALDIRL